VSEREPQTVDRVTSATPGSDWQDVEEGAEYTPEQLARKFLDSDWDKQVAIMNKAVETAGMAAACQMLNHEGAHVFATQHTCHDRYQEGFEAGKQALADHMEALADDMFAPTATRES
jgi:hypothetical protein